MLKDLTSWPDFWGYPPPLCRLPPLPSPPPLGGNCHFDSIFFPLCSLVLPMLAPPIRVDSSLHSMYAIGAHVWYHSRSKGGPLLATVIAPSGPQFLHI